MPIYEYKCSCCGNNIEVLQKISDEPIQSCGCGGSMKRAVTASNFRLKGTGWYETDFKRAKK